MLKVCEEAPLDWAPLPAPRHGSASGADVSWILMLRVAFRGRCMGHGPADRSENTSRLLRHASSVVAFKIG